MPIPSYYEYHYEESNFGFPEDIIVPDMAPKTENKKPYRPTIWKAILTVDIEQYAMQYLGYKKQTEKGKDYFTAYGKEGIRIGKDENGNGVWRSVYSPSGGDILALIKRQKAMTTGELAKEIKRILKAYQIPYYDKFEEEEKQKRVNTLGEQKSTQDFSHEWEADNISISFEPEYQSYFFHDEEEHFPSSYDFTAPMIDDADIISDEEKRAIEKGLELNRSLFAIEKTSQPFFSESGKIRGIPEEFIQIMGSKLPESSAFLKNQEERAYTQNLVYYTERKTEDGVKKNLNFILKDIKNRIVGMAQNNGETGEATGGLVRGSEEAFFVVGNRDSKNIVFSPNPFESIAFNIDKKQNFANTYHFASVGDFPYKRLKEIKELLKERIREDKPTFFRLAFDTDVRGDNKIELFEKEFRGIFDGADPEKFKMIDSRCNKNFLNYSEQINSLRAEKKQTKHTKQNTRRPK